MDFRGLVEKRVWKMTFFGLKLGKDLVENRVAHPHQEFKKKKHVQMNSKLRPTVI